MHCWHSNHAMQVQDATAKGNNNVTEQVSHRANKQRTNNKECVVDGVTFCVSGLGLCTRIGVQMISHAELSYQLLGQLIDELLFTLQLAGCILGVTIRHLRHSPRMRIIGRVSSMGGVAMEGCGLASGPSTLCSEEAF